MKKILLFVLLLNVFFLSAQIPPGYYNSAAGLTGSSLQTALHNIIKNHTVVSYASLWTHFQTTDKKPSGKVWDIYSDIPGGTPPYEFTFVTDQCGSYSGEADCYNREHSWPQSWFSSATVPSSDMFHLYPTDGYVNNRRSNYPYGDVGTATWTSLNGSKLGVCSDPGYSSTVFEPIDDYKGDVARSYFYMSTRYLTEDASWSTSGATNKSVLLPWQVNVLLQWHHQDTVSTKEVERNNDIYGIQNNRNPFIDHPEWADSIWVSITTGLNEQISSDHSLHIYPDPSSDIFYISCDGNKNTKAQVSVSNALGKIIISDKNAELNSDGYLVKCENWETGIYFITVIQNETSRCLRFVKIK
jgi:endonuclease I